jgi:membrane protein DedA with SNARE-associated domain
MGAGAFTTAVDAVSEIVEPDVLTRHRRLLIGLGVGRIALAGVALILVPVFYEDHFLWVTLLRPTKEVLLGGGFLVRRGDLFLVPLLLVALPLLVGGVWLWYLLGISYRDEIQDRELPGIAGRLLPRASVLDLGEALRASGWRLVFFGRLAAFPSSVLAAAAGTSGMDRRTFLLADLAGALTSLALVVGAGYALGEAYRRAGLWLTLVGLAVLVGVAVLFGTHLKRVSRGRDR